MPGVVRKLDTLGRITLPKALCVDKGWKEGDRLGFTVDGESVYLHKHFVIQQTLFINKLEENYRIVVPKEIRKTWGIDDNERAALSIASVGKLRIRLQRYYETCMICGNETNEIKLGKNGVRLCRHCVTEACKQLGITVEPQKWTYTHLA